MSNNPFFSIIIPTYNRSDLITVAINSVLNQTFQDFEIIVVDDGSTDNTEEVVNSIKDERIRYFKKENEERSIARNFGIENAKGKYICFLDADDYFLDHHLNKVHEYITGDDNIKIIHSNYEIRNENNKLIRKSKLIEKDVNFNILIDNPLICNSIVIKKELLEEHKFIHNKNAILAEDWYLWIVLISKNKLYILNDITTIVVEHSDRSLNQLNPIKVKNSFDLVVKNLENNKDVIKRFGKRNLYNFASERYIFSAYTALSQKKYFLFFKSLIKAFKYSPLKTIDRLLKKIKGKS